MPDAANQLRAIKTFGTLIRYLEDELDWPLAEFGFDDLTFEYSPAELGLKDKDAAKVKAIHQLRPLHHDQPWGIFFVEFENKRMPVVVLRRILSHLVLKKRASANKAQMAAWHRDDLLFISAYGAETADQREIAFAHFHQETGDLPTLRVLGWDGADTPLKLEHVAFTLKQRLCWPADPSDADAWRDQWSPAFRHCLGHVIRTADALADRLAVLARGIREAARTLMDHESDNGRLRLLHKAFQTALIHDLSEADFADTYAQTITYGLLTAAISRTDMTGGRYGTALVATNVTDMVPITNPFLCEMLQTFLQAGGRQAGIDFDELGIQDVVELLRGDETDLPAILRDFGNRTRGEDPVIHFYEHFLAAYDKRLKVKRGIFYTPQPAVSYIVRGVHELLQTEFGIEDGLASTITWAEMASRPPGLKIPDGTDPVSPFVVVLDIATGTATFIVEVIDVIYRTLSAKWTCQRLTASQQAAAWNDYVPKHLLPRLFGYELMMAPYAIAHMKVGLKLYETGYRFASDERVRVYLTNTLEPPQDFSDQFASLAPALAHEARAVDAVKRHQRYTVIIGNPPYSQYSMNLSQTAKAHIEKFRFANGERIHARNALQLERNLNDDYVKFLGFSSDLTPRGTGILGMITNRMFLDSESLVGLREWFAVNFERTFVIDLCGSSEESRRVARLSGDENVFDILQGVAISFFVRHRPEPSAPSTVLSREVIGKREEKYRLLDDNLAIGGAGWSATRPRPRMWWLNRETSDVSIDGREFTLAEIFPSFSTLVASNRDRLVVGFECADVLQRVAAVQAFGGSNGQWAERFNITLKKGWNATAARQKLKALPDLLPYIHLVEYRPFDRRWIFFHPTLVWQTAPVVSGNVLIGRFNRVLVSLGKNRAETVNGQWVVQTLSDKSVVSTRDNASGFPLYLYDDPGELNLSGGSGRPNIAPAFLRHLAKRLGPSQADHDGLPHGIMPEDIFGYVYAVLYSPSYRSHYTECLKTDFPRLPLTSSLDLFRVLAALGGELVALHLMESPKLDHHITTYLGPAQPEVEKVTYERDTAWLDKAQARGFRGVPPEVWAFHIGGYQVCDKWLKDRKGRVLSPEDIEHYQRVVVALNETIRLMQEIDEVIAAHGGWPIR